MSDATMEQKLRLVQQVRSRYQEGQYDLSHHRQMDFYFIAGKRQETILKAYAYLCGTL